MAASAFIELAVYQGDYFEQPFRWREATLDGQPGNPISLTLVTITGGVLSPTGTILPFTVIKADQATQPGLFTIGLTSEQTAQLSPNGTDYDVQFTQDGKPFTPFHGRMNVTRQRT